MVKSALLTSVGLIAVASPAAGLAQSSGEERVSTARDDNVIIVTAQRREQTLQEVPLAVSVLTGDELDNNFVNDVENLVELAPSLSFNQGNGDRNNTLSIRGIGTSVFSVSVEPSVSTVIDGVVLTRPGAAFSDLVDIERIEILRGPQGTLFGKNATAGVLNIVTKDPSRTFEGFVDGLIAEGGEHQVRGSLSGPIGDNLGFRASAVYRDRDGHIQNVFDGSKLNGSQSFGLRGKLKWEVSNLVNVQLIGDYNESNADCCQWQIRSSNNAGFLEELLPVVPGPENDQVNVNGINRNDSTQWGGSLEVNIDMGGATLTSITAYREWKNTGANDVDSEASAVPRFPRLAFNQVGMSDTQTFTQELRVASNDEQFLEYVAGIYIYDADIFRRLDRDIIACVAPGATPDGCGFPFPLTGFFETNVETTNFAAFGQFEFNLTDQLSLIVGGRGLVEDVSFNFVRFGNISGGPAGPFGKNTSDTNLSLKAGLTYEFTPDLNAYATYQQGYKGRAFDAVIDLQETELPGQPIDAETVDSFEVGLKAFVPSIALNLNFAAFYTKYDNFQGQTFDAPAARFVLANVGEVETKGIEFDFILRPTAGLSLSGGAAYIDATIVEFPNAQCYSGQTPAQGCIGGLQDLADANLPNSPKFKFNVNGRYEAEFSDQGWRGFGQVGYVWQDDIQYALNQNPATIQEAYGLANASIGVISPDDTFEISVFVQNAFDKTFAATIFQTPLDGGGISHILNRNYERYFGASARVRF